MNPVHLLICTSLAIGSGLAVTGCSKGNGVKFSEAAYGPASRRVTRSRHVRPGGGRRKLGKPYRIAGRLYVPQDEPDYDRTGTASWYGPNFHGRLTANGEVYNQFALSAAHPTLPLPSYVRVTNLANGHSLIVRVNDRGPYTGGRLIDLSSAAARELGFRDVGLTRARVRYVGPAPLHGRDASYLRRSFKKVTVAGNVGSPSATDPTRLTDRFILAAYAPVLAAEPSTDPLRFAPR